MDGHNRLDNGFEQLEARATSLVPCQWTSGQLMVRPRSEKLQSLDWKKATLTYTAAELLAMSETERRKASISVINGLARFKPNDFYNGYFKGEDFLNHEARHVEEIMRLRVNIDIQSVVVDTTLTYDENRYGMASITSHEGIAVPLNDLENLIVGLAPLRPSSGDIFAAVSCLLRMDKRGEVTPELLLDLMKMCEGKISVNHGKIEPFDFVKKIGIYLIRSYSM